MEQANSSSSSSLSSSSSSSLSSSSSSSSSSLSSSSSSLSSSSSSLSSSSSSLSSSSSSLSSSFSSLSFSSQSLSSSVSSSPSSLPSSSSSVSFSSSPSSSSFSSFCPSSSSSSPPHSSFSSPSLFSSSSSTKVVSPTNWGAELQRLKWGTPDFGFFKVNAWGSCQYSNALSTFNLVTRMCKEMDLAKALKTLKVEVIYPEKTVSWKETVEPEFRKKAGAHAQEIADIRGEYETKAEEDEETKAIEDEKVAIAAVKNCDEILAWCRNSAWDLWAAAPFVANLVGIKVSVAPKAGGRGPLLNVLTQGGNIVTGLYCAVLYQLGYVKEKVSFAGFDT